MVKHMDAPEVHMFEADKEAGKVNVKKHGSGTKEGNAPVKDL